MAFLTTQREFYIEDQTNSSSGIYCIKNVFNNKIYIGQAQNYQVRAKKYRSSLELDKCHNQYLQNSYNKSNTCFKIFLIEECPIDQLDTREIFWIKFYKTEQPEFGYNLREGGHSARGWKHSEETRKKFSKILYDKLQNKIIDHKKPLLAYKTSDGSFYKEYCCIKEASKDLNIDAHTISKVLKSKKYIDKGYYFINKSSSVIEKRIMIDKSLTKVLGNRSRKVKIFDYKTKELLGEFNTIRELCKKFLISEKTIHSNFFRKGIKSTIADFPGLGYTIKKFEKI